MNPKSLISFTAAALAALLCVPVTGSAQSILLSAGNFTLLSGTGITSTGTTGTTIISGNVGLSPGPTTGITGFPPAVVVGGGAIIGTGGQTGQARLDLQKAMVGLAGMPTGTDMSNVDLGGKTLLPGVYTFNGAATQNGALVLDAHFQNNAYWVFQIATGLTTSSSSTVTIINPGSNGGSDDGIFWNAGTAVTIGSNNTIKGNYLAGTSITFGGTTSGQGRGLALAAVTLDVTVINSQGGPSGSDWTGGLIYSPLGAVVGNPPLFTTQPVNQSVAAGSNATFIVAASNGATYLWQRQPFGSIVYANLTNAGAYSGTNTTTLVITNATLAMSGDQFRAVASNFGGNVTSTSALLTVTTPLPVFSAQPADQAVSAGANATYTVAASGNSTIQWQRQPFGTIVYANLTNTGAYSNVTGTVLNVSNTTQAMSGDQFRAVATNLGGSTSSTSALLTVTTVLPIFSVQPANQAIATGANATFTAAANGNATFQWQREPFGNLTYANLTNTGAYSNVTGTVLLVTNATFVMSGDQFRAVATNLGGSTTSTSALLSVTPPIPAFTSQPSNQSGTSGGNSTFTVVASNGASFQWQRLPAGGSSYANLTNSGAYSGVTTGTLTVANTTFAMSGDQFRVIATNGGGSTPSNSVTLSVIPTVPVITQQPSNTTVRVTLDASFTVVAVGTPPLTYSWQRNGVTINNGPRYKGAKTATLLLHHMVFFDALNYRVVVTNGAGKTTSANAKLTVSPWRLP
jgi:hypothetical protein